MVAAIPYGQFVGGLVGACFWLLLAVWLLYFRPRSVRGKIARGELDETDRTAKLKKASLLGYVFIVIAICDAITTLAQADFFRDSIIPGVIVFSLAVALLLFLITSRRKTDS